MSEQAKRGVYCDCGGCRFTLDEDTGSPDFSNRCREGHRLYHTFVECEPWTPEGNAVRLAYLEHTRKAWPAEWFSPIDGHYISSDEWQQRHAIELAMSKRPVAAE